MKTTTKIILSVLICIISTLICCAGVYLSIQIHLAFIPLAAISAVSTIFSGATIIALIMNEL